MNCNETHPNDKLGIPPITTPSFQWYVFEVVQREGLSLQTHIWIAHHSEVKNYALIDQRDFKRGLVAGFNDYQEAEDFACMVYPNLDIVSAT